MADHLTPQQIQGYRQRALDADERLRVSEHLYACDDCRRLVKSGIAPTALADSLKADADESQVDEHLTAEEMAAYVEEKIDAEDRLFVQAHIQGCTACAFQIKELQQFRAILSTYPEEVYAPAVRPGPFQRFLSRLRLSDRRRLLPMLGSMAAGGLAVFLLTRPHPAPPQPNIARQLAELQMQLEQERAESKHNEVKYLAAQEQAKRTKAELQQQASKLQTSQKLYAMANAQLQQQGIKLKQQRLKSLDAPLLPPDVQNESAHLAMRGDAETLNKPVATYIREAQPEFSWKPQIGAISYTVTVKDEHDKPIRFFSTGSATSGISPRDLPRGRVLSWSVNAKMPDNDLSKLLGTEHFRILSATQIKAVDDDLTFLKQVHLDTPVMRGKVFLRYHLLDEAERQFKLTAPTDPKAKFQLDVLRRLRHPEPTNPQ